MTRGIWHNIFRKLRQSVAYLEQNRNTQTSPAGQAILTYALALQNSPHKFAANQKLRGMSSLDSGKVNHMGLYSDFHMADRIRRGGCSTSFPKIRSFPRMQTRAKARLSCHFSASKSKIDFE
jgi:hypothetical protein